VNGKAPNKGLDGMFVGIADQALPTNGFKPFFRASTPLEVKIPHLTSSRRETVPCERAWITSRRLLRDFSASRMRAADALPNKYMFLFSKKTLL